MLKCIIFKIYFSWMELVHKQYEKSISILNYTSKNYYKPLLSIFLSIRFNQYKYTDT